MPLQRLYYCQKNDEKDFSIIKFCRFSLADGKLKILAEPCSEWKKNWYELRSNF